MKKIWSLILCFSLLSSFLSGCTKKLPKQEVNAFFFDTVVRIVIFDPPDEDIKKECIDICKKYDSLLSVSSKKGDIYKINQSKGEEIKVNPETVSILKKSFEISNLTDGLFSVTVEPISSLWDFRGSDKIIPDKDKILEMKKSIGNDKFILTENTVKKLDENAGIDLGGIGKGFIADKIKTHLVNRGVKSALINLGGNIVAVGKKLDGNDFKIGIQKPFSSQGDVITDLSINNSSAVTSGVYERYFRKNNKLYHHILNPNTGMPENNDLFSVTIVSKDSILADALSTSVYLLGLERGLDFVKKNDEVINAVFVTSDFEIIKY